MLDDDELMIELTGPHGTIDPRAVADAINAVDKIVRNIAGDGPASLTVSHLAIGSAKFGIRADPQRIGLVRQGVDELAILSRVPPGWSPESVTGLVELEHVSRRRGVRKVLLKTADVIADIDASIAQHAEESIAPSPPSLGSLRGNLHRYMNDRKRSAGLRDYRTGHAVEIVFPSALTSQVRSALDHEVEVWGQIRRDIHDQPKSITIVGIEIIDESRATVTLDDVAGIFGPNWTDGLDPAEWVSRQRD